MNKWLFVDVDHTVADAWHRDPLLGDWNAYHVASENDAVIREIATLVRDLRTAGWIVIILTARPSHWRKITERWLVKHRIIFDRMLMRDGPDGSYENYPTPVVKFRLFKKFYEDYIDTEHDIFVVLEDRNDVTAELIANGITVLQAHIGRRMKHEDNR